MKLRNDNATGKRELKIKEFQIAVLPLPYPYKDKDLVTGEIIDKVELRPGTLIYALAEDGRIYECAGGHWMALPLKPHEPTTRLPPNNGQ
jgi:hypothetical protein